MAGFLKNYIKIRMGETIAKYLQQIYQGRKYLHQIYHKKSFGQNPSMQKLNFIIDMTSCVI